jgi:hypothetical protein
MKTQSYHIFYFPFKWSVKGRENLLFSEQTKLNIPWNSMMNWLDNPEIKDEQEKKELYNEKNYYYEFVHPVLYDTGEPDSILKHFERKEPQERDQDVSYIISTRNGKTYTLKVEAINLNLYITGVGMLTFFLKNEREDQKEPEDILKINQYGRRIFPPFSDDITGKYETAEYLSIEGLNGNSSLFYEDFASYTDLKPWKPARFITNLIVDLSEKLEIEPVIDDRMFVNCWYGNDTLSDKYANKDKEGFDKYLENEDFWYKYVFVDVSTVTCQNDNMRKEILTEQTYKRWQKDGTLFGVSRYSFVVLTTENGFSGNLLKIHMRTIYSRMIELLIIQRASILKFSAVITHVSKLSENKKGYEYLIAQTGSLYKNYICFVNQVYFREITAQDQGIELYNLMSEIWETEHQIKDLDNEIEELHHYVSLLDDRVRNKNAEKLNKIAAIFLPAAAIVGFFGMNAKNFPYNLDCIFVQTICVLLGTAIMYLILKLINKNK